MSTTPGSEPVVCRTSSRLLGALSAPHDASITHVQEQLKAAKATSTRLADAESQRCELEAKVQALSQAKPRFIENKDKVGDATIIHCRR
eukprot:29104-Eustigmatos_ZCMA.PRE.1